MKKYAILTAALLAAMAVMAAAVTSCAPNDAQTPAPTITVSEPMDEPTIMQDAKQDATPGVAEALPYNGATVESSEPRFTYDDAILIAKTVWGEALICAPEEQRLVVWTILQRVDAGGVFKTHDTIKAVITAPGQFIGYKESNPLDPDIYSLCVEVLTDWQNGAEPLTHEIYAPTAPYYYFEGDGRHNWFREEW